MCVGCAYDIARDAKSTNNRDEKAVSENFWRRISIGIIRATCEIYFILSSNFSLAFLLLQIMIDLQRYFRLIKFNARNALEWSMNVEWMAYEIVDERLIMAKSPRSNLAPVAIESPTKLRISAKHR